MKQILAFLAGPGLIAALLIFFCGLTFRLLWYFRGLDWRLDRVAYRPRMSAGMAGGLHSIYRWLLPYGTHGWRSHPLLALCFFLFHMGLVLLPPFLLGHTVVFGQAFGFSAPALPQLAADMLAVLSLLGGLFLLLRRISLPETRLLSTFSDYALSALVLLALASGILARMRAESYDLWLLLHIAAGELTLILAPFTKLSHMVLFFATRWQLGADYAIKRGGHRRGPCFPW
jgi:nitrate reductase gamma subunit